MEAIIKADYVDHPSFVDYKIVYNPENRQYHIYANGCRIALECVINHFKWGGIVEDHR